MLYGGIACIVIGLLLELLTTGVLATLGYVLVVLGVILLVVALILLLVARSRADRLP